MYKYKDDFIIKRPIDKRNGKPTPNKDDNFIPCKDGFEIYRYGESELAIMFIKSIAKRKNRVKAIMDAGVNIYCKFGKDSGNILAGESVYCFPEKDLYTVAAIVGAKKRRKISEEHKQILRDNAKYGFKKIKLY